MFSLYKIYSHELRLSRFENILYPRIQRFAKQITVENYIAPTLAMWQTQSFDNATPSPLPLANPVFFVTLMTP